MLQNLNLRDFILVETLNLDFQSGFLALTGETGAGKSILIDALSFVLGERADISVIREGKERSVIHATFSIDEKILALLKEKDLENKDDPQNLILRRVIEKNGKSRAYINDNPVSLQTLKSVGEMLVDIHSQNAHQSLLKSETQRQILDEEAELIEAVLELKNLYQEWKNAEKILNAAQTDLTHFQQKKEQLLWQKEDLENLSPLKNEWEDLEKEEKRLNHAEQFLKTIESALHHFFENDFPVDKQIRQNIVAFENLAKWDSAFNEILTLFHSVENELTEIQSFLLHAQNRIHLDPERLNAVNLRMESFLQVARKYRVNVAELPEFYQETLTKLANLESQLDLKTLSQNVENAEKKYLEKATVLSQKRKAAAQKMNEAITQTMAQLAMASRFEARLIPLEKPAAFGLETVEFFIATHANTFLPLSKIASGGELSRISLSIEVFSSRANTVPTLIFDEVDVGIGGAVAEIVGNLLKNLAQNKQILCITHLPQVAACAHHQWQVKKQEENGKTVSHIHYLTPQARVYEIARMLGGVELTPITLAHAQELLQ